MSEILTLQIRKKNFDLILEGKQKTETREILPTTAKRYIVFNDKNEAESFRIYKALRLINGRKPNAPELTVEVLNEEMIYVMDEKDEHVTFEYKGEVYIQCYVEYELGKVIDHKNTKPAKAKAAKAAKPAKAKAKAKK